jgi:glycerate kinase
LDAVDASSIDSRIGATVFMLATDVTNPLCGPDGASLVYGPQKGAAPEIALQLDEALARYASVIERDLRVAVAEVPGAGSAGGLGAGLIAFCGAQVRSGFDVVAEAVDLEARIAHADVVVTGEGRLDDQTSFGKTPAGVARICRRLRVPVVAVAGEVAWADTEGMFDATFDVRSLASSSDDAMVRASEHLTRLARDGLGSWMRKAF